MKSEITYNGKLYSPLLRQEILQSPDLTKKAAVHFRGDYAAISSKNLTAYYGWECTDDDGNWCFKANFNDTEIIIPFSKLDNKDRYDCYACLLKGISWLMEKYKLSL